MVIDQIRSRLVLQFLNKKTSYACSVEIET